MNLRTKRQRPASARRSSGGLRCHPVIESLEDRFLLATYVVTTTADAGTGSLRQAILNANANAGQNTIQFNINGGGLQTIAPASPLPPLTNPVIIDGTTEPGYSGKPLIVLDGLSAGSNSVGLDLQGGNSVVNSLVIERFSNSGLFLDTKGGDLIVNNYLGTDYTGTLAFGNSASGISVSSSNNTIGGSLAGQPNLISGNVAYGINFFQNVSGNLVAGNKIGTDITGTKILANHYSGIGLYGGSHNNTIGGTTAGAGNLISGNGSSNLGDGITIFGGATANGVYGNYIGTDVTGTLALGNNLNGVALAASGNVIGTSLGSGGNLISGNHAYGIDIYASGSNNSIVANAIGTDASGTKAVPNAFSGIGIDDGAQNNTVGGTGSGSGNLISGNGVGNLGDGISIFGGAAGNSVLGNRIGTNISGTGPLPNNLNGIAIGANNNTIGGATAGAGNVISGNQDYGISLFSGATGNVIAGNTIGTNASGSAALPNGFSGINVSGAAKNNTIGGTLAAQRNLISGNFNYGIVVTGTGTSGNRIEGNYIGTDASGSQRLANTNSGIGLVSGASGNTVGGLVSGAGNVISGNNVYGVVLLGSGGNAVQGNFIGTDASGSQPLGNGDTGVGVLQGSANNLIGGPDAGAGNVLSANANYGVALFDAATGNIVQNNFIGTDNTGTQPLGNFYGVGLYGGANANYVAGNLISGNGSFGVLMFNATTTGNTLQGNLIGTDGSGTQPLGNGDSGIDIQDGAHDNTVGGTTDGAGNVIGFNARDGVRIDGGTGNAVQENSISNDGHLGIELLNGGNNGEAAPAITAARTNGTTVVAVEGNLSSLPDTDFTLEFFASPGANGSGFGEGQQFLGSITVTTDDTGYATFAVGFQAAVAPGEVLTATATDSANNTSEFSAYFTLNSHGTPAAALNGLGNQSASSLPTSSVIRSAAQPAADQGQVVDHYFATLAPKAGQAVPVHAHADALSLGDPLGLEKGLGIG